MDPGDHSAKFLANTAPSTSMLWSDRREVGNTPPSHLIQQKPPTVTNPLSILALTNTHMNNVWEYISAISSDEDAELLCPPPPPDIDFLLKWDKIVLDHSHGHHQNSCACR